MSILNAWNPVLRTEQISRIEGIIDYKFQKSERAYLWEALQVITPVMTHVAGRYVKEGNKKLAIIGDAVMANTLAEYWYSNDNSILGDWGNLSGSRLSNEHLNKVAAEKNLVDCLDRPSDACGKKSPATLLEAIVGSVYVDSDYDMGAVRKTMIALGFEEVLHNVSSQRNPEVLGRPPASDICSIAIEYSVPNSGGSGQTVVYRTIPVSRT